MTQVSFQRKRLPISTLIALIVFIRKRIIRVIIRKRFRKLSAWFFGCFSVLLMFAWNPKLVLATGVGIGLMLLVYQLQNWNGYLKWSKLQQFFTGSPGKLTVAVGSGGLSAIGTYIAASIWADSENRWLAVGSILQGMGTLLTLGLLIWHILTHQEKHKEVIFERWLSDLTAVDPLKRLIAVQQLTSLVNQQRLSSKEQCQLKDYFRFMLVNEIEPSIRSSLGKNLQQWESLPPLESPLQPLQIPLNLVKEMREVRK